MVISLVNIKKQTLSEQIFEKIKDDILSGKVKKGEKLTEKKLAEEMGVSQTPVRESFNKLSSLGLIKIIPWKGAIVLEYSHKHRRDTYECRSVLEQLAIELAVLNIQDEELKQLKYLSNQYKNTNDSDEIFNISTEIHELILKVANNNKLSFLLEHLKDVIYYDRNISSIDDQRKAEIIKEHKEIIKNIELHDITEAKKSMHRHIMNGLNYMYNE